MCACVRVRACVRACVCMCIWSWECCVEAGFSRESFIGAVPRTLLTPLGVCIQGVVALPIMNEASPLAPIAVT